MKKVAVIGLGQFGKTVAETLTKQGAEVLAIDKDPKIIEDFKDNVSLAVEMDATNEESLKKQGIEDMDVAVVAIGEREFLSAVLVTTLLKKIGIPTVIARGMRTASRIEERILDLVGADRIILPSVETAKRLAQSILATNILSYMPVSEGYSLVKIQAPTKFIDKKIGDLQLRKEYKVNLIGIKRGEQEVNYLPQAEDEIKEGDLLFIIGREEDVEKLGKEGELKIKSKKKK